MDKNEQVKQDDEVENSTGSTSTTESASDLATVLITLDELIKSHIESVAKLKIELKEQREMFEDSFNNSPAYKEHADKVKEATKAKLSVKKQISSQPSVAIIAQKIKDMRADLADKNRTLTDLVADYRDKTGATQIETRDGKVLEIVSTVKLVNRSSK
jgi:hypothetical protein